MQAELERRTAGRTVSLFEVYLRTGVWLRVQDGGSMELKFNPWHDPMDGRFTFVGAGHYFGRSGGGFQGGGGGSFGGGGATGQWTGAPNGKSRTAKPRSDSKPVVAGQAGRAALRVGVAIPAKPSPLTPLSKVRNPPAPARRSSAGIRQTVRLRNVSTDIDAVQQTISKNGYTFEMDSIERTRRASGTLTLNPTQKRSRSVQARAGGEDRRTTDHGGHYIARQFNGPTEAFNHFAQDANFNVGAYRALEERWVKAARKGSKVMVDVIPHYTGRSLRPNEITVRYTVDGAPGKSIFSNAPRGR